MNRLLAAGLFLGASAALFGATACEQMKALPFTNASVTESELVAAGPYKVPGPPGAPAAETMLPAHCRIAATLRPSSDSDIKMELWLPVAGWNDRFEGVGNGGWAGNVTYAGMAQALKEGYATASTDTGHAGGGDGAFALGHMEKVIDYSYRAVHEMTLKSKQMMEAFYGRGARFAYWNGCSYGGRQGLEEAQRYPEDYDGILAGAPANYHLHLHAFDLNVSKTNLQDAAHMVPQEKLALLNKAVLAACDGQDGVKDGILTDPHKCNFDPAALLCPSVTPSDTSNCLTAAQLETVKTMYAPAKTKSGNVVYPGMPMGGELGWNRLYTPEPMGVPLGSYKYVLNQDANWDWKKFDLDRDVAAVDEKAGSTLNAINPDLTAFQKHGGKLLMYHGWSDQLISAENSISYYQSVLTKMGANQSNWYRLFMMPGMMHCRGGAGPDQFSMMGIIERWRETNTPPEQITAMHVAQNRVDMTRPLCPYPQVAAYKGQGNPSDAGNFACRAR